MHAIASWIGYMVIVYFVIGLIAGTGLVVIAKKEGRSQDDPPLLFTFVLATLCWPVLVYMAIWDLTK